VLGHSHIWWDLTFYLLSDLITFCYSECLDVDGSPVPRPPKLTHQRSHSKPLSFPCNPSATLNTSSPPDGQQLRNSWSESSVEEAPPLPPRGQSESQAPIFHCGPIISQILCFFRHSKLAVWSLIKCIFFTHSFYFLRSLFDVLTSNISFIRVPNTEKCDVTASNRTH
jgi:hypothetical protein